MSNIGLKDFRFFRTWPRDVFKLKKNGRLCIKEVGALRDSGVYVLYIGREPHYVGKGDDIFSRLHDHANKATDRHYLHWDYFSVFMLQKTVKDKRAKMVELESILIAAMPNLANSSRPKFKRFEIPKELRKMLEQNGRYEVGTQSMAAGAGG